MLNVGQGRRDLIVALVGRTVSRFGDGVALVALTLRMQADGAHPWEIALLLGGGLREVAATIPLIFLHSVVPIVLLVAVLGAATSLTGATWAALVPRIVGEDPVAAAGSAQ